MTRVLRGVVSPAVVAIAVALADATGDAHKPITSPYTFNEHVFPILRAQCGACHVQGGVAPMSLTTHAETVPWGESIRAELMAGHMPPWSVDSARGRIQHEQVLTAHELNVLMTWASGGTPAGDPAKAPSDAAPVPFWPLGDPDLALPFPAEHRMAADAQEEIAEFTIPTGTREARWVRALDLLPGTPAIVRSATVRVKATAAADAAGMVPEAVLAVWVPGDRPVTPEGAAFALPAGAELVVRVHYKKTWAYERQEMADRSTVGVYFAPAAAPAIGALPLAPAPDANASAVPAATTPAASAATTADPAQTVSFTRVIDADLRALAIYPDPALANARVTVSASRPDGSREELIAFRPQRQWARRYWFAAPIELPRGTRIEVNANLADPLLPPGALPVTPPNASDVRLTLNVIEAKR